MTTTEDLVSFAPPVRRQPVALSVAVGAAVVVGWVLYRHYWLDDLSIRIARWSVLNERFWAYTLMVALLLTVPYAVVLLVWGRGLGRAAAGAGVAVGAGLVFWGIDHVFSDYVWNQSIDRVTAERIYVWSMLLVPALLVPLAWGLARRSGQGWLLGLVVGPVVAVILREVQLRWSWWHARVSPAAPDHSWVLQAVVFVAPFVLAVLACWAIEARARRTSEMGSSA